jgi:hypothetical protein
VAVLVAAVGVSCSGGHERSAEDSRQAPRTAATAGGPGGASASSAPTDPARQLEDEVAALRDPSASGHVRRLAGERLQLTVRDLADAPPAEVARTTARLGPGLASMVREMVRASRLLSGITAPQQHLPPWRIVAPAPPRELLGYYRDAQRRTGVPWTVLAAINLVESRMGRIRGTSPAGAHGPMQFVRPTWELYGAGGDINDPHDAVLAAARLLRAGGAPEHLSAALWHYNQSRSYVRAVTGYARILQRRPWMYDGFWSWRVLYSLGRGTFVLPVGYPRSRPERLAGG